MKQLKLKKPPTPLEELRAANRLLYPAPADYNKEIKICEKLMSSYLTFCDQGHPLVCNKRSGIIYYHRHQASVKIGRWVYSNEIVHHRNGIKTDNRFENLHVLTTRTEHSKLPGHGRHPKKK